MTHATTRSLILLALVALLGGSCGCSMMQRKPKSTTSVTVGNLSSDQPGVGQLTSRRMGDHERALRMGRDVLRENGLLDKYDVNSATAYDKGDHWEVRFTPKNGPAKRLRRKAYVFPY